MRAAIAGVSPEEAAAAEELWHKLRAARGSEDDPKRALDEVSEWCKARPCGATCLLAAKAHLAAGLGWLCHHIVSEVVPAQQAAGNSMQEREAAMALACDSMLALFLQQALVFAAQGGVEFRSLQCFYLACLLAYWLRGVGAAQTTFNVFTTTRFAEQQRLKVLLAEAEAEQAAGKSATQAAVLAFWSDPSTEPVLGERMPFECGESKAGLGGYVQRALLEGAERLATAIADDADMHAGRLRPQLSPLFQSIARVKTDPTVFLSARIQFADDLISGDDRKHLKRAITDLMAGVAELQVPSGAVAVGPGSKFAPSHAAARQQERAVNIERLQKKRQQSQAQRAAAEAATARATAGAAPKPIVPKPELIRAYLAQQLKAATAGAAGGGKNSAAADASQAALALVATAPSQLRQMLGQLKSEGLAAASLANEMDALLSYARAQQAMQAAQAAQRGPGSQQRGQQAERPPALVYCLPAAPAAGGGEGAGRGAALHIIETQAAFQSAFEQQARQPEAAKAMEEGLVASFPELSALMELCDLPDALKSSQPLAGSQVVLRAGDLQLPEPGSLAYVLAPGDKALLADLAERGAPELDRIHDCAPGRRQQRHAGAPQRGGPRPCTPPAPGAPGAGSAASPPGSDGGSASEYGSAAESLDEEVCSVLGVECKRLGRGVDPESLGYYELEEQLTSHLTPLDRYQLRLLYKTERWLEAAVELGLPLSRDLDLLAFIMEGQATDDHNDEEFVLVARAAVSRALRGRAMLRALAALRGGAPPPRRDLVTLSAALAAREWSSSALAQMLEPPTLHAAVAQGIQAADAEVTRTVFVGFIKQPDVEGTGQQQQRVERGSRSERGGAEAEAPPPPGVVVGQRGARQKGSRAAQQQQQEQERQPAAPAAGQAKPEQGGAEEEGRLLEISDIIKEEMCYVAPVQVAAQVLLPLLLAAAGTPPPPPAVAPGDGVGRGGAAQQPPRPAREPPTPQQRDWLLGVKREAGEAVLLALTALQQRGRLSTPVATQLSLFVEQAMALQREQQDEAGAGAGEAAEDGPGRAAAPVGAAMSGAVGNNVDGGRTIEVDGARLSGTLMHLGQLSLPALAQVYAFCCQLVAERFLDLPDLDERFQALLPLPAPEGELGQHDAVGLTRRGLQQLVEQHENSGRKKGDSTADDAEGPSAEQCAAALAAFACGGAAGGHGGKRGGGGGGHAAADAATEPPQGQAVADAACALLAAAQRQLCLHALLFRVHIEGLAEVERAVEADRACAAAFTCGLEAGAHRPERERPEREPEPERARGQPGGEAPTEDGATSGAAEDAGRLQETAEQTRIQHCRVTRALLACSLPRDALFANHQRCLACAGDEVARQLQRQAKRQEQRGEPVSAECQLHLAQVKHAARTAAGHVAQKEAAVAKSVAGLGGGEDAPALGGQVMAELHKVTSALAGIDAILKDTAETGDAPYEAAVGVVARAGALKGLAHLAQRLHSARSALVNILGTDSITLVEWSHCRTLLALAALRRACVAHVPSRLAQLLLTGVLPLAWQREHDTNQASQSNAAFAELLAEEEAEKAVKAAKEEKRKAGKKKGGAATGGSKKAAPAPAALGSRQGSGDSAWDGEVAETAGAPRAVAAAEGAEAEAEAASSPDQPPEGYLRMMEELAKEEERQRSQAAQPAGAGAAPERAAAPSGGSRPASASEGAAAAEAAPAGGKNRGRAPEDAGWQEVGRKVLCRQQQAPAPAPAPSQPRHDIAKQARVWEREQRNAPPPPAPSPPQHRQQWGGGEWGEAGASWGQPRARAPATQRQPRQQQHRQQQWHVQEDIPPPPPIVWDGRGPPPPVAGWRHPPGQGAGWGPRPAGAARPPQEWGQAPGPAHAWQAGAPSAPVVVTFSEPGPGPAAASYQQQRQGEQGGEFEEEEDDAEMGDLMQMLGISGHSTSMSAELPSPPPLASGGAASWAAVPVPPPSPARAPPPPPIHPGVAPPPAPPAPPAPAPARAQAQGAQPWLAPGQSVEDAELEMALEASRVDAAANRHHAEQATALAGYASTAGAAAPGAADASELGLAGLSNEAGEYNCFLNVIIQCLWHCAEFRQGAMAWPPEVYNSDPVVAALHGLFRELGAEERERQAAAPLTGTAARRRAVSPNVLRLALGAMAGRDFQVGEMSDAGEVLLAVYERIRGVHPEAAALVDDKFGLWVREYVKCTKPSCGLSTHNSRFTQYFFNTSATALRLTRIAHGGDLPLGRLLRVIEDQSPKSCDTDKRGCGALYPVTQVLERAPRVFSLQLAWESHREAGADIAATLGAIDERVDLGHVYSGLDPNTCVYRLRSVVAYYGCHYQAFIFMPDLNAWVAFDDAAVSRVGSWADVLRKCEAGRIQPSVLFFILSG